MTRSGEPGASATGGNATSGRDQPGRLLLCCRIAEVARLQLGKTDRLGFSEAILESPGLARVHVAVKVESQRDASLRHHAKHIRRQLEPSVDALHHQVANQVHGESGGQ